MGFFDFFKPKKNDLWDLVKQINNNCFPKGEKDIIAATEAVLHILNNSIDYAEARDIAVKTVSISRIAKDFTVDRLKLHLSGYCLHHFNDSQINVLYGYLTFLKVADQLFKKSSSDLIRNGDSWVIPE